MNLKDATPEQKIQALAELDGLDSKYIYAYAHKGEQPSVWYAHPDIFPAQFMGKYLTSYDAIIPLVQKQKLDVDAWYKFKSLIPMITGTHSQDMLYATPSQLADALLIATGKFEL